MGLQNINYYEIFEIYKTSILQIYRKLKTEREREREKGEINKIKKVDGKIESKLYIWERERERDRVRESEGENSTTVNITNHNNGKPQSKQQ